MHNTSTCLAMIGKGDGSLDVGVCWGIRLGKLIINLKPMFGVRWDLVRILGIGLLNSLSPFTPQLPCHRPNNGLYVSYPQNTHSLTLNPLNQTHCKHQKGKWRIGAVTISAINVRIYVDTDPCS